MQGAEYREPQSMFVVYTFAALIGALFAALAWLRVAPPPADPSADGPTPAEGGYRRAWTLPLCVFGLVGLTLHLLGRPFVYTLVLSFLVGPPVGLLGGWVSGRINGD